MQIIHMMCVIGFVVNDMLPEKALPKSRLERIWTHCARRTGGCQTPHSPFAIRTVDRRSVRGIACAKRILIDFQGWKNRRRRAAGFKRMEWEVHHSGNIWRKPTMVPYYELRGLSAIRSETQQAFRQHSIFMQFRHAPDN